MLQLSKSDILGTSSSLVIDPELRADAKFVEIFRTASLVSAIIVLSYALLGSAGWIFDVEFLKHPFEVKPAPQPATLVAFVFIGLALLVFWAPIRAQVSRVALAVLGIFVSLVGMVNYVEHLMGVDWNLAQPIFQMSDAKPLTFPGNIQPDVAFGLFIFGIALALNGKKLKNFDLTKLLALLLLLPNFVIVGGYICGTPHLCYYFGCLRLSAFASLLFSLAAFSLMFTYPQRGFTNIFVLNTFGGRLMRSIMLGVISLVPILHLIRAAGSSGLFNGDAAAVLMSLAAISILGGCIAWGARRIDSIEVENSIQVQSLRESLEFSAANPVKQRKLVCLTCSSEFDDESMETCPNDGTSLSQITNDVAIGSMFAERYQILSLLGKGGNSAVYKAKHVLLNKLVAVKVLQVHLASDPKAVLRFQREAQSTAALSHPSILSVQDFGLSPDGRAYLVMDLLDGESLSDLLNSTGAMSWQDAIPLLIQIFDALDHAHSKGIIHRDLKPSNIMILNGAEGTRTAKIVDFGLARAIELDEANKLTMTGEIFGSPFYMSPEQCKGENLDQRSDIYSMGCVIYQMLANRPPFMGANAFETIKKHVFDLTPPLPQTGQHGVIPKWLTQLTMQCMAKEPETRPNSAGYIRDRLQAEFLAALSPQNVR